MKKLLFSGWIFALCYHAQLIGHCQMPCGIYHDDMVFDQIDQYVETMAKGISVLQDNKFETIQDRNEFMRWVLEKDKASDEVAELIMTFFMQQKIKPGEEDTTKRVLSAHKLLSLLVPIKQTVDLKFLNDFYEEWEQFKLMFHIQGYECKLEQIKLKKWAEKRKADLEKQGLNGEDSLDHDHDHSHDDEHDHTH